MAYPPSHRSVDDPQPEFCELCGLKVGGGHLKMSEVEGLEGLLICDVTPSCRIMRSAFTHHDRMREQVIEPVIGQSRVFPPGDENWEDITTDDYAILQESGYLILLESSTGNRWKLLLEQ
jgi:hypothetical protein